MQPFPHPNDGLVAEIFKFENVYTQTDDSSTGRL